MKKRKNLYKIIKEETISYTAYVFATNEEQAKNRVLYSDVHERSNQDFGQAILSIELISKKRYPAEISINK